MKKFISILLAVSLLAGMNMTALASYQTGIDPISIEEYEAAIKAAGETYGIECEVLDYDANVQITQEMVDNAVVDVRLYAESIITEASSDSHTVDNTSGNDLRAMPVTKDVSGYFESKNIYGTADIHVFANVTIDVQNSYVISVNSTDAYQQGGFVNFVSWETTSISPALNKPSVGWITLNVKGRSTFSFTNPTGITTGYTQAENQFIKIECG